jgi:CheY-like chemotaxis protein
MESGTQMLTGTVFIRITSCRERGFGTISTATLTAPIPASWNYAGHWGKDAGKDRCRGAARAGQAGVRVVVADDDVLLREGLASLLTRSGYQVVGQAGEATTLLELVRTEKPELAIVDIRMPPTCTNDRVDAAMIIREEMPKVGLVILSAHVDVEHAMQLLASDRAVGYLLKTRVTRRGSADRRGRPPLGCRRCRLLSRATAARRRAAGG